MDDVTAMEARTRSVLHRATDGLLVTEDDMDRMEGELMTLLETRPSEGRTPRRGRWEWGVAAAAVAALVLGGAALWQVNHDQTAPAVPAPAPAPTWPLVPPELVGLWQNQPDSPWLWEFRADGRVLITDTVAGYLKGVSPSSTRVVARRGDRLTMRDDENDASNCAPMQVAFISPERVDLRDGCQPDAETLHLERISPRDPAGPALQPRFPHEVSRPVTEETQLEGSWLHVESGRLLAVGIPLVGGALTYLMDDDGDGSTHPDQRGVLTVEPDGSVRPQPKAGDAGACAPAFSKVMSTTASIITTSADGGCFPAGSTQTWLRLN
jgi:hypothetical protein